MRIVLSMKSTKENASRVPVNITLDPDIKRLAVALAESRGENLSETVERLLLADAQLEPAKKMLSDAVDKRLGLLNQTLNKSLHAVAPTKSEKSTMEKALRRMEREKRPDHGG